MFVRKVWRGRLPLALLACGTCLGCTSAHYVIKNPDSGVIAIPEDRPELRAQAEKLMHVHLPQGYVIDQARDVAVGPPHRTVVQVGFVREVQWRQDHEVFLYYHALGKAPAYPVSATPLPIQVVPSAAPVAAAPVPAAPTAAQPPAGLPPQPLPLGN
jgi:hypothetical protein